MYTLSTTTVLQYKSTPSMFDPFVSVTKQTTMRSHYLCANSTGHSLLRDSLQQETATKRNKHNRKRRQDTITTTATTRKAPPGRAPLPASGEKRQLHLPPVYRRRPRAEVQHCRNFVETDVVCRRRRRQHFVTVITNF